MHEKIKLSVTALFIALASGLGGATWSAAQVPVDAGALGVQPEIVIIDFKTIVGDQLELEVFGPARLLWGKDQMLEQTGVQSIPLGQLPNADDLNFKEFAYTANAKTGKFYPSSSYPARGTEVWARRFFQTKQAAIAAGFVPTKLVK